MEPLINPDVQPKRSAPWGVIIGIILILSIVVAGAYYSFTKRYHPRAAVQPGQTSSY